MIIETAAYSDFGVPSWLKKIGRVIDPTSKNSVVGSAVRSVVPGASVVQDAAAAAARARAKAKPTPVQQAKQIVQTAVQQAQQTAQVVQQKPALSAGVVLGAAGIIGAGLFFAFGRGR